MFHKLVHEWDHLTPAQVAAKVKRFFYYYSINCLKMTPLVGGGGSRFHTSNAPHATTMGAILATVTRWRSMNRFSLPKSCSRREMRLSQNAPRRQFRRICHVAKLQPHTTFF
jgi:hypothetical protein